MHGEVVPTVNLQRIRTEVHMPHSLTIEDFSRVALNFFILAM